MQILVNSDNHIEINQGLTQLVEAEVEHALGEFGNQTTRVQVHVSDQNSSQKGGDSDKRCLIEARLAGLQPIAVSHQGSTVEQAVEGAAEKMKDTLHQVLGRLGNRKGRTSFSGE